MKAARSANTIPTATFTALCDYLRISGSTLSTTDAIISAVTQWIAAGRTVAEPACGYQWKQVFLPDGTQLRMQYEAQWS